MTSRIKVKTLINTEFDFGDVKLLLDKYQYNVVISDIDKNLRIIACAGSGKTTTILCRIKYLLDKNIDPKRILLTTFNTDAAETLKTRLKKLLKKDPLLRIGTFDSISAYFYYKYFKIDGFVGVNEYVNLFLKYLNSENGKTILDQYDYIFFDEFQDINDQQFQIIKKFYDNGSKIIAIGDDAQNIYQWRGSNIDYILNFDKTFQNTITFKLENNYRSTPEVINMASAIIRNNTDQIEKEMLPNNSPGKKPLIVKYKNSIDQSTSIIHKIKKLIKNGVKNDEIIIISRNNFGLKLFEEQLEMNNRDSDFKINYLAMINDNDKTISKDYKGKVCIATIHKIKGGEWEYVFIIDLDDKIFPSDCDDIGIQEERRLLYVAVTRAKLELELSFCSNTICRFIKEIPAETYEFPTFRKTFFENDNKRSVQIKTKVTELIKQLKNEDYETMRSLKIIPDFKPTEDKIHEPSKIEEQITKNNLQSDYGIYIDTYISRRFGLKNNKSKGLENTVAKCIIYSIELNHFEYAIYIESKCAQNLLLYGESYVYMIDTMYDWPIKKIGNLTDLVYKIINKAKQLNVNPYEVYITKDGFLPNEFTNSMEESYKKYIKNENIELKHIYNMSLCPNIYMNRRRLLYKDCFQIFDSNKTIYDGIDKYCNKYAKNDIHIKKTSVDTDNTICGELDMYDATLRKIVDFKTSTAKQIQIEWVIQLLAYCALLRLYEKLPVDYVSIYNPLSGYEYIIDVNGWNKEKELLDMLANTREEKITKVTKVTDKNNKSSSNTKSDMLPRKKEKYSKREIDPSIKKDIRLDFLDDDLVEEYYKMKNNMKK
jgi:hypothetical protein